MSCFFRTASKKLEGTFTTRLNKKIIKMLICLHDCMKDDQLMKLLSKLIITFYNLEIFVLD